LLLPAQVEADLTAAGWKMTGPDETKDGGLTVSFERGFRTPEEATAVLAQVNASQQTVLKLLQ